MDFEVWKHLADHEEILRLVLARVSWDTNLRLRPVSKAWNDILLESSKFLTWSSMLTDRDFYVDYPELKWVDGSTSIESNATADVPSCSSKQQEQTPTTGDAICILSTSQTTCAMVNFGIYRWCKLPPMTQLPFGHWNEFTVIGSAEGLLLLERNHGRYRNEDSYELDRFFFNPVTQDFSKLPPVPRNPHSMSNFLNYPMMITVDNDRCIRVVAVELAEEEYDMGRKITRILIWERNVSCGWEAVDTNCPAGSRRDVEEAVFASGELFLNTRCYYTELGVLMRGHRLIKCKWETHSVVIGDFDYNPIQHLFQYRGVLMRVTGTWKQGKERTYQLPQPPSLKLCTFDHLNGTWLQESTIEMPKQMVNKVHDTLSDGHVRKVFVRVEGDILCIGITDHFKGEVLLLYNLLSQSWTEVCLKNLLRMQRISYLEDSNFCPQTAPSGHA
ncbi:hypothetical protein R1sor_004033 [Riccia sorocarpa]|uniref:F-box domain-containing protein n=1 Tax=Riccia sorocarpa TaxID=122646 RepID=A0ABD3H5I5_9MARC